MIIVVSAEHDAEIRRVSLTNLGSHAREIELTSYAEIALAPQAADVAHPAFQNLFVQTEFAPDIGALLATRRPRSRDEQPIWAAHVAAVEEAGGGVIQYETDRARFLGRGRSVRSAVSVIDGRPLSNTVGSVLDPIFSLRCRVRLAPGATAHAIFSTVVAESRDEVLDLADKYRDAATFERAATLAWTQAQVQLHHLGIEADEAHLFQRLANRILYSDPSLRPSPGLLAQNERGARGLWAYGISGDLPIVLVRIDEVGGPRHRPPAAARARVLAAEAARRRPRDPQRARHDVRGGSAGRARGPRPDEPVIAGARGPPGSRRRPHPARRPDLRRGPDAAPGDGAGRAAEPSGQPRRPGHPPRAPGEGRPRRRQPAPAPAPAAGEAVPPQPELEFFNGLGGFADDGREYVTILGPGQATPAPWLNVIANPAFGFQVSESGSGYTWSGNSRENQLTPVVQRPGQRPRRARRSTSGTTTPASCGRRRRSRSVSRTRRTSPITDPGYSRFEHAHDGIGLDLAPVRRRSTMP